MPTFADLAGHYAGAPRIRPGAENSLSPAELKGLLREAAPAPLELREDGTYRHRGAVEGRCTLDGVNLRLQPVSFDGMTLAQMRTRAEEMGREFGLAWLFDPIDLVVEDDGTLATAGSGVVQVAYTRGQVVPVEAKKRGRPKKA